MNQTILLIPAFNPDERLIGLLEKLKNSAFDQIIVIDDGSLEECDYVFQQVRKSGCTLLRHKKNLGKGAALKTGITGAREIFGSKNAYVTADCDGQHLPEDILKVADALRRHPDSLILGTRDFDQDGVPLRSRFGNRFTSVVFYLATGIHCPDTQTGLRGIPARLEELAATEEGKRYEYEMNLLSDSAGKVRFIYIPIRTVYQDKNAGSHFMWFFDSLLVYGRFLRFAAASLVGAVTDLTLFYLFYRLFELPQTLDIFLSTGLARICSGTVNFLMNRYFSFKSKKPIGTEATRYFVLFVLQMFLSSSLVSLLVMWTLPEMPAKIVVDTCLFFISYVIQKNWVFKKSEQKQ